MTREEYDALPADHKRRVDAIMANAAVPLAWVTTTILDGHLMYGFKHDPAFVPHQWESGDPDEGVL